MAALSRVLCGMALVSSVALPAASQQAPVTLPETRPGQLMARWLDICGKPDVGQMTAWEQESLRGQFLKEPGASASAERDLASCRANGGFRVVEVVESTPQRLVVKAKGRAQEGLHRIVVAVDEAGKTDPVQIESAAAEGAAAGEVTAADIAGSWDGEATVKNGDQSNVVQLRAEFKHDGAKLSGTVGPSPSMQMPLSEVTLAGRKLTFTAAMPMRTLRFDLAIVAPDRLEGTLTSEGEGASGPVTFKRTGAK